MRGEKFWLWITLLVIAFLAATSLWWNKASSGSYFLGDSLTMGWSYPRTNAGIFGQTTDQILARFPAGMAARHFNTVYILAGTNDVLLHRPPEPAVANIERMVTMARAQGVKPVVATIPPIFRGGGAYEPAVLELNRQIRSMAGRQHACLIDYWSALNGHPSFESDGVHMKKLGYLAMEWELLKDTQRCN